MVNSLPFISRPDKVTGKASDVSAADWRCKLRKEKLSKFYTCTVYIIEFLKPRDFFPSKILLLSSSICWIF